MAKNAVAMTQSQMLSKFAKNGNIFIGLINN